MSMLAKCHAGLMWLVLVAPPWYGLARVVAAASDQAASLLSVDVGFGGHYKVGTFTPVRITLACGTDSGDITLRLITLDSDGVSTETTALATEIRDEHDSGQHLAVGYVKFGRVQSSLTVVLEADQREQDRKILRGAKLGKPVLASQQLVLAIGRPIGLDNAIRRRSRTASERIVLSQVPDARQFPDRWFGYQGLDMLVLSTTDANTYESFSPKQRTAMSRWVNGGGRLLLTVGADGERVFGEHGPLRDLVPGRYAGTVSRPDLSELDTFTGGNSVLSRVIRANDDWTTSRLDGVDGRVLLEVGAFSKRAPALVQGARGWGQVLFCSLDLDSPAFSRWPDRGLFVAKLLDIMLGPSDEDSRQQSGRAVHLGYEDLAGQLRAALDRFPPAQQEGKPFDPGVSILSFSIFCALAALYIAIIGPGEFFLMKNRNRRGLVTWVAFPVTVILFAFGTHGLNGHWKSSRAKINQLDLVDIDAQDGLTRGTTLAHLYSPETASLDMQLKITSPVPFDAGQQDVLLTNGGLPGSGFGGMNSSVRDSSRKISYELRWNDQSSHDISLFPDGFPIRTRSTRSLVSNWSANVSSLPSFQLKVRSDNRLDGEFKNPFSFSIENGWLAYNRFVYQFSRLEAGESVDLSRQIRPRRLDWVLARRRFEDAKERTTVWDPRDLDVDRIMEMIMFHDVAGGRTYTQLLNRQHRDLEASSLLALDRAVFVGHADHRATSVTLHQQDIDASDRRHWTYYRLVIPVQHE